MEGNGRVTPAQTQEPNIFVFQRPETFTFDTFATVSYETRYGIAKEEDKKRQRKKKRSGLKKVLRLIKEAGGGDCSLTSKFHRNVIIE